jgi:putative redox protein
MTAELLWTQDLRFTATSRSQSFVIDSQGVAGPSPMQLLAVAFAGCMSMDVADIIRKGRHQVTGLAVSLTADLAQEPPKRFIAVRIHFRIAGAVPGAVVERAIDLSRQRYCSVWHSLRQDLPLTTTFDIVA